jgi:16S rRNA (cytosine967-C5)-methyltransferase
MYLRLARDGAQADASSFPFEYRYSCSSYVADILKNYAEWAEYLNETPPTTLCVNFNKRTLDQVLTLLQQENLPAERSILPTALHTTSVSKYSTVLQQRLAHVQDESSQLVSFLAASYGDSIVDWCAGNGGKSLAIASMTKNKKNLHAYEMNAAKRTTLKRRCHEYNADVIIKDHPPKEKYDLVLVDAPCTGLGAARRNPEAKYIESAGDLPQTQLSILRQAATNVKENGVLFYVVCTITPEETTQVVQTFIKDDGFSLTWFDDNPYQKYLLKDTYGGFSTLPRGDLFYLSLLRKE